MPSAISNQPLTEGERKRALLLLLLGRRLGREERGRLRRHPVEQVARLHEAAGIRARAEDHYGHVLAAALEAQHGREAVAGLRDEAGLPRADVDVPFAQQVIRAVEDDRTLAAVDRVLVRAHDRRDALVLRG